MTWCTIPIIEVRSTLKDLYYTKWKSTIDSTSER